ncbi:MAG TPA: helix-turn-helix transcriptional regulator [Blastocatellia bacterium]|nr:helix-turn-helix transcriptional regulator [Blastocatellia bacterium]
MRRLRSHRLPEKLLQIRESLGLTPEQLVEQLGLKGSLTEKDIAKYEQGQAEPPLVVLLRYARLIRRATDALIDDEQDLREGVGEVKDEADQVD